MTVRSGGRTATRRGGIAAFGARSAARARSDIDLATAVPMNATTLANAGAGRNAPLNSHAATAMTVNG
jgi:hypothetical protein